MSLVLLATLSQIAVAAVAVDAPITAVTVYSDRARVTRTASVVLAGVDRIELPLILDGVDPSTLRVEAVGGDVRRVDIARVEADRFPVAEAQALLGKIEQLDDQLGQNRRNHEAHQAVAEAIRRIVPSVATGDPLKPAPRLNPSGWTQVLAFTDGWLDRMQARLRVLDGERFDLERQRAELGERARLLGGVERRAGYRVSASVAGKGPAQLFLSYMVEGARWTPSYDIQLVAETGRVNVSFAGQVGQETGEDWLDAALTLSTAVPATSTVYPTVLTWKIGERERFIPTPVPASEWVPPAPPSVPPLGGEPVDEALRARLAALGAAGGERGGRDEDADSPSLAKRRPPVDASEVDEGTKESIKMSSEELPAAPPPPAAEAPAFDSVLQSAPAKSRWAHRAGPASKASSTPYPASSVSTLENARSRESSEPAASEVGLAPPAAWRPPTYSPDLPVSLAGGYDLAFPSLRPETVRSGKGTRRVALFVESWPVSVERKVFPALAPDAYLVAEIKNPSQRVLPGGPASLSVGDDPAGVAKLNLVAPGEAFTLPLGLDRAIRPKRNVKLVLTEKGIFAKDEVSEYTVTTEIANPYRVAMALRVIDQIPISSDKNVEIKLGRVNPAATVFDPVQGTLEWRLTVPPSGKSVVTFVYTLRRPRGWRMHQ